MEQAEVIEVYNDYVTCTYRVHYRVRGVAKVRRISHELMCERQDLAGDHEALIAYLEEQDAENRAA